MITLKIKESRYSDIPADFRKDFMNDVGVVTNERAVTQSIAGIITTRKGTRPFWPTFGCVITDEMFQNISPLSAENIKMSIEDAIREWEPRVARISANVFPQPNENKYTVVVYYTLKGIEETFKTTYELAP